MVQSHYQRDNNWSSNSPISECTSSTSSSLSHSPANTVFHYNRQSGDSVVHQRHYISNFLFYSISLVIWLLFQITIVNRANQSLAVNIPNSFLYDKFKTFFPPPLYLAITFSKAVNFSEHGGKERLPICHARKKQKRPPPFLWLEVSSEILEAGIPLLLRERSKATVC